jgi:hypothetical protein
MKNYTLEEAKNILRSEGWTPNPYDFFKSFDVDIPEQAISGACAGNEVLDSWIEGAVRFNEALLKSKCAYLATQSLELAGWVYQLTFIK